MPLKRKIDHFVYCVPDLEAAMESFEKMTGCQPVFGGYHTTQGTKNALVNLGYQCYLEFLAIDKENKKITNNRWMGIDLIEKPTMTRWALKSSVIELESEILKEYNSDLSQVAGGQRKTPNGKMLKWKLTMPLFKPKVELIPFLIDWQNSDVHPTDNLPNECEFVGLEFRTPHPQLLSNIFEQFSFDAKVIKAKEPEIKLSIKSVKGLLKFKR